MEELSDLQLYDCPVMSTSPDLQRAVEKVDEMDCVVLAVHDDLLDVRRLLGGLSSDGEGLLKRKRGQDWVAHKNLVCDFKHVKAVKKNSEVVYGADMEKEKPSVVEKKVYLQGATKTELCKNWEAGSCTYEDKCRFAHGTEELLPIIRHLKYEKEVCRTVFSGNDCSFGHRCHFRHTLTEEEEERMK